MLHHKAAQGPQAEVPSAKGSGSDRSGANVDPVITPIGAYLKSREGKRWTSEDTRAILARAAEIDRVMEQLICLVGIPVAGSSESERAAGSAFPFRVTAHVT